MIPGKSKYEKASNEILAKQNEIVSMMERYINCPEAVAAMRAVDAVTGEPIDAMGVYRHDGFCWSTEDFYNFKRYGLVDYGSERSIAVFQHFLEIAS